MYNSLAYRSIAIARAAHFPFLSLSLSPLFFSSLSILPFYRATHPLCHYCQERYGKSTPPRAIVSSRRFSSFVLSLFFIHDSAGCFLNKRRQRRIIRKFLSARHSRVHLQINRTVNNDVVGHIVTVVECESQLPASMQDIHSCFWKKNRVDEKTQRILFLYFFVNRSGKMVSALLRLTQTRVISFTGKIYIVELLKFV